MQFCTCDLNPTHAEPGLGAGFVFHPRVHSKLKKTKTRNLKESRKTLKKTQNPKETRKKSERNSFTKPHPNLT
jgi:hypothetical protein